MQRTDLMKCVQKLAPAVFATWAMASSVQAAGEVGATPPFARLQVTAQQLAASTDVRVDESSSGLGTRFGLEDDLGMPRRQTIASALPAIRLGEAWHLEAEVSRLSRSVRKDRLAVPLEVDGVDYSVGALVDSTFDFTVNSFALGRMGPKAFAEVSF